MSEVINGVPRELLERVAKPVEAQYDRDQRWKALEELRALLTAQPQASAAQSAPDERAGFEAWIKREAGEGAAKRWPTDNGPGYANDRVQDYRTGWVECLAWQRAQSAPVVPEGWSKSLGSCWPSDEDYPQGDWSIGTVDEDGNRYEVVRVEASQYDAEGESQKIAEAIVRLWGSAAPQQAAHGEFGDAYQGAREDLAIWKRRALEAEAKVRHQDQIIDHLTLEAQGETRMGEPVIPAARQEQGDEVRRLREALRDARELIGHGDFSTGICMCGSGVDGHTIGDGHAPTDEGDYYAGQVMERIDAALAASTGQEV